MSNPYTGIKAHEKIKKAFEGVIDFPDNALSYEFCLEVGKYSLSINYHNKDSVIIESKVDSIKIDEILRSIFVFLPSNVSLIRFEVHPEKAFTLNVDYLADFK